MLEIERDLEATQDPRLNSPNKPFLLAQMAAVRLNIAPKPKTPAAPPAPAAAPVVPSPKKQQLPAGGSRTVPAVSQPNGDVDRISQIQTPQQLKAELKRLGIAQ